jgi:hypothetical protein
MLDIGLGVPQRVISVTVRKIIPRWYMEKQIVKTKDDGSPKGWLRDRLN